MELENLFGFGLLCFTSYFTLINPFGVVPIYISMTEGLNEKSSRLVALKASCTTLFVLIFFALAGDFIFTLFNISIHGLKIVGGVLFFIMGYDMLQARFIRTKQSSEAIKSYETDIAITPLGIPMMAGPGAITATMVYMRECQTLGHKFAL